MEVLPCADGTVVGNRSQRRTGNGRSYALAASVPGIVRCTRIVVIAGRSGQRSTTYYAQAISRASADVHTGGFDGACAGAAAERNEEIPVLRGKSSERIVNDLERRATRVIVDIDSEYRDPGIRWQCLATSAATAVVLSEADLLRGNFGIGSVLEAVARGGHG